MTIVSHQFGFIFCKTRKTAGTSLEVYLGQRCGPRDVVTPITPPNPLHHARNNRGFNNHMPLSKVKAILGDDFGRYFKFCVERHPVEKCISHYAMLAYSPEHRKPGPRRSWDDYVRKGHFPMDYGMYTSEEGELLVDRIYRYEELDGMLAELAERFGWPYEPLGVREKTGFRGEAPTVGDVTERQRQIIFEAFRPTLALVPY